MVEVVEKELPVSPDFIIDQFVQLFKQLSENGKNKLATYFYLHNQAKFIAAEKNHVECAKETLYGNPYYTEFFVLADLRRPIVELTVEIASSIDNDVEENVVPSEAETAIE